MNIFILIQSVLVTVVKINFHNVSDCNLDRMVTVQSTVDTGHEDMIHDAQMDFYGTRLATCSSDR